MVVRIFRTMRSYNKVKNNFSSHNYEMTEILNNKIVLILGIVAVTLIGVNLTLFIGLYSTSRSLSASYSMLEGLEDSGKISFAIGKESISLTDQERGTIKVSGTGVSRARPDRALVSLSIITQADNAKEAISENTAKMNNVINSLKAMGIAENQIETSAYSLNPLWNYSELNVPRLVGYTCSSTIKVTVKDLNKIGEVIDNAVSAGVNHISHIRFTISDEALLLLESEALRIAVKDAESKARVIANAAGKTLTNLLSISYSTDTTIRYSLESIMIVPTPSVSTSIIPPEEISVTVNVSAIYEFK